MVPVVLVGLVVIWDLLVRAGVLTGLVFPLPVEVLSAGWDLATSPTFWGNVWTTGLEALLGFLIATVVGLGLAVLLTQWSLAARVAMPYIVFFQTLPKVALAPIFIIWLGFGMSSKVMLSFAIAFFPILINGIRGIERVPARSIALMRSLDASSAQRFRMLTVPASLPYVFAGLRAGATLALIGAVVGEFITARQGLGRLVTQYSTQFRQPEMWAVTIAIGLLGLAVYGSIAWLSRRLVWWEA